MKTAQIEKNRSKREQEIKENIKKRERGRAIIIFSSKEHNMANKFLTWKTRYIVESLSQNYKQIFCAT